MTKIHFRPYNSNQTVLFPQRIDEDIAEHDPVRMVDALVESLNLESFRKLYKECGRSPYHPRMMLKVILYAYMNNVYSCRKIEKLLHRDIHYIWLAGYEKPDFITINRFRNRVKKEINEVFTQTVLLLSSKGFIRLNVEYIDGTKIESKANKYTFVWRKTVERNCERLMKKIHVLLGQIDDVIAQENSSESNEEIEFTPAMLTEMAGELRKALEQVPEPLCIFVRPNNDRLMVVLKNGLLLHGVLYTVLDLVRGLLRLEVHQTAGVLPVFEDMHDGVRRPLALIAGVVAAGAARPAVFKRSRRGDLLLCEHTGYLGRTIPGKAEVVYLLDYGCSFLVNNEIFILVHEVAIHRLACDRLATHAF